MKVFAPTDISIITTYRCPMQCKMCNIWKNPTDPRLEIQPEELEILPHVKFINITGGEPFIREDLDKIVEVAFRKAPRVVISTSGWFEERVLELARKFPKIGIRISIEGLSQKNDELRGRAGGFDKGLRTLLSLREMGVKDIGFGITVSNNNSEDMLSLYRLSKALNMEFATAAFHNSYYFHKDDNVITNRRMLPCEAGLMNCFIDPYGEVYPCNGLEAKYWKESMGNIRQANSFSDIWSSEQAQHVRSLVRKCPKNCWMVGTVSPVMKKFAYARHPMGWIIKNKLRSLLGKPVCLDKKWYDVGQDPMQGNLGRE